MTSPRIQDHELASAGEHELPSTGEEISLRQHESSLSPKRRRARNDSADDSSDGGMKKYYLLCALIWLIAIGVIGYVVPTFVLNKEDENSNAAMNQPSIAFPSAPTHSPAPIVTRKPTKANPDSSSSPATPFPTISPKPTVETTTNAPITPSPTIAASQQPSPTAITITDDPSTVALVLTDTPTASITDSPTGGALVLTDAPTASITDSPTGGALVLTDAPTASITDYPTGGALVLTDAPTASITDSPTEATDFPTFAPNPVRDYIVSISINGGNEFLFPETYQSKALNWILTQQLPSLPNLTMEQQSQQLYALGCLYYSTFGVANLATDQFWLPYLPDGISTLPGWLDDNGWMTDAATLCSGWYGIVCDDNNRVGAIELRDNRLSGSIPPELALLKESLWYLDVRDNLVANIGAPAHTFFSELTNLEYLLIGSTYFVYDGIPNEVFALTKLIELDISYMLWYGELGLNGNLWGNLQNLETLNMGGNEYNSTLPEELVTLPNLRYLYADFTNVEGNLDFVSRMPRIEQLWIDMNTMTGTIPSSIGSVQTLRSLSFTECNIGGPIPTEFGNMSNLKELWMSHNKLTGEIPVEFSKISTLQRLHLQGNDLIGDMPAEICFRVFPFGRITSLQVDCDNEVNCDSNCCTCCGPTCSDA